MPPFSNHRQGLGAPSTSTCMEAEVPLVSQVSGRLIGPKLRPHEFKGPSPRFSSTRRVTSSNSITQNSSRIHPLHSSRRPKSKMFQDLPSNNINSFNPVNSFNNVWNNYNVIYGEAAHDRDPAHP